jgi:superfamily I DNA/RNA helicase
MARLAQLYRELGARQPVTRAIERVREHLDLEVPARDAQAQGRVEQLLRLAGRYGERLDDFLEAVVSHNETDEFDPRADRVALMTLHSAKGLEFPVVFIVGCEEGLLPYMRRGEEPDVEEERRLLYVGMTRAQQRLVLTHATKRVLYGQTLDNVPSRFVSDIEDALKVVKEMEARRREPRTEPGQMALF